MIDDSTAVEHTRRWLQSFVIDLNLCPFAQRVFQGDKIRYVVTRAANELALVAALKDELAFLQTTPATEVTTTLLIHPHVFGDFLDYNEFLDVADGVLDELELVGTIQIASFHPHYQFAETDVDAPENYTNRSPYPMLHLLREESVSEIADRPEELLEIPQRNVATMNALGKERIEQMLKALAPKDGPLQSPNAG